MGGGLIPVWRAFGFDGLVLASGTAGGRGLMGWGAGALVLVMRSAPSYALGSKLCG
ncbi:hypothetical protein PJE062_887 [Pseudovibrio sp. JE062]|nr:hypothetical protein PJE062_887 [Pseudovibrio sp. JE062]